MFKQLEPALEFDDGKVMGKSMSKNNQDVRSNTSGTMNSHEGTSKKQLFGGETNLADQTEATKARLLSQPISEVVSSALTPELSPSETMSERRRLERHTQDTRNVNPYKKKLSRIN
jgi:hypothetical protein